MKNRISINDAGQYEILSKSKSTSDDYSKLLVIYLNRIKPLFDLAKGSNEFEYACTLIAYKSLQEPGWEPFDNTIEIFDSMNKLKDRTKDEFTKLNLIFWVYGHIVEASQPYELFANFFRIIDGEAYSINNFPDKQKGKYLVPQFPAEKIEKLVELSRKVNLETSLIPLNEVFDRELRNSIFHSNYTIYGGEIRAYRQFTRDETYLILNKVLAYFESLKILYNNAIKEYQESKVVDLPSRFSYQQGRLIVRKNHGLIGVKDNLTSEEIMRRNLPFHMGKFRYHEMQILRRNPTINEMPVDATAKLHSVYVKINNMLPKKFHKLLNKAYQKRLRKVQNNLISRTLTEPTQ